MAQEHVVSLAIVVAAIAFWLGHQDGMRHARKLRRFGVDLQAWKDDREPLPDEPRAPLQVVGR
jgi:hypothetical protein